MNLILTVLFYAVDSYRLDHSDLRHHPYHTLWENRHHFQCQRHFHALKHNRRSLLVDFLVLGNGKNKINQKG